MTEHKPSPEWFARAYAMASLQRQGWSGKRIAEHYGLGFRTVHTILSKLRRWDPTVPYRYTPNPYPATAVGTGRRTRKAHQ